MIFPDIPRAFLDRVSMSVAIVFPQTARTEVQVCVLSPVTPSRAWASAIIGTISIAFHHADHRILSASKRLTKRLPLTEEKV